MTASRFVVATAVGLGIAAVCLALSAVVDSAALALVGVVFVLGALAAKTAWTWQNRGRAWLLWSGLLGLVIAGAFLISALTT